jgi:hypothetical protein
MTEKRGGGTDDETVEDVEERAEEALDTVEEALEEVEDAVDEAEGAIGTESVELRHEHEIHIRQAVNEVRDTVEQQREKLENQAEGLLDTVEETVERAEETLEEVEDAVEERRVKVEETVEDAGETAEEQREVMESRAEETLDAVGGGVERLLKDVLETNARVSVYVALRKTGEATPEEVVEESGLYPGKVESVLEGLEDDGFVRSADGRYEAVPPTRIVRNVPGLVGGWLEDAMGVRDGGDGPDVNLEAVYDKENGEVTVRLNETGEADYLNVLVDGEVRHTFQSPSPGDEVTLKKGAGEEVTARSGYVGDGG